eukprot:jgi/Galph1/5508/GphlegSOOS_G4184.1
MAVCQWDGSITAFQSLFLGTSQYDKPHLIPLRNKLYLSKHKSRQSCIHSMHVHVKEPLIAPTQDRKLPALGLSRVNLYCKQWYKNLLFVHFCRRAAKIKMKYASSLSLLPLCLCFSSLPLSFVSTFSVQKFIEAFQVTAIARVMGRTFLVTALLATRYQPLLVVTGSVTALILTSIIAYVAAISGLEELLYLIPFSWIHYGTIILFLGFGAQLIRHSDSLEEEENMIESQELIGAESQMKTFRGDTGEEKPSTIFLKILGMSLLSEWCGQSMSTVMSISTTYNVFPILSGVILSNLLCILGIVLFIWLIMRKLSAKRATNVSGLTLIGMALFYLFRGPAPN